MREDEVKEDGVREDGVREDEVREDEVRVERGGSEGQVDREELSEKEIFRVSE